MNQRLSRQKLLTACDTLGQSPQKFCGLLVKQ
jgi:hypothetical protein